MMCALLVFPILAAIAGLCAYRHYTAHQAFRAAGPAAKRLEDAIGEQSIEWRSGSPRFPLAAATKVSTAAALGVGKTALRGRNRG